MSTEIPHADSTWFREARFGMFIHWGIMAATGRGCLIQEQERIPPAEYERKYFRHFNPDRYDPAGWARRARRAGMKYVTIVAKHHDGFCLWDTAHNEFKATNAPCGRDLLAPMVEAFRAEGLRIGLYYSLIDWHDPDFTVDMKHPLRADPAERAQNPQRDMDRFRRKMRGELTELMTRFGPVDIVWFDWSYPGPDGKGREDWDSEALCRIIKEHQPQALVTNRYDFAEGADFETPEQWQPTEPLRDQEGRAVLFEACQTFSGSLAWSYAREDDDWKPVDLLLRMLIETVSSGGNMLLNVAPTARGKFDPRTCRYLDTIGEWMELHGRSIYGCGPAPAGIEPPQNCFLTYHPATHRLYIHLCAWPHKHVYLHGMSGHLAYAQFLHDGAEVLTHTRPARDAVMNAETDAQARVEDVTFTLPSKRPDVAVPVIEIFLGEDT
jgi:alpha-L-fucosidase